MEAPAIQPDCVSIVQPPTAERFRERGIEPRYVFVHPNGEELQELADLVDAGELTVHV